MSSIVRKRTFWHARPTRTQISLHIRAVWLESSLLDDETLHLWIFKMRPGKILIRLRIRAVWSESSLGAHVRRYVFWLRGSDGRLAFQRRPHGVHIDMQPSFYNDRRNMRWSLLRATKHPDFYCAAICVACYRLKFKRSECVWVCVCGWVGVCVLCVCVCVGGGGGA